MTAHMTAPDAAITAAVPRLIAWGRVLEAMAEQREALLYRIWLADPHDTQLEADCRAWCELSRALAAFLKARSAAR